MLKLLLAVTVSAGLSGYSQDSVRTAPHHLKASDFTSAAKCGDCHVEIYQQWTNSAHSRAATDPIFWQMLPTAARDLESRGLGAGFCLKCHAPVATVDNELSMYTNTAYPPHISPVAMEGVTCDFCHTISGKENFGKDISKGAYLYPHKGETAIKYGTHRDAANSNHLAMESKFLESAELCGICHNFPHPFSSGEQLQDTYEEWKSGPYSAMKIQCQDCHMPEHPGASALGTAERKDLHYHFFPGGRSDLVKKVATVAATARLKQKSGKSVVNLDATVINIGSGHYMPTGLPGLRQMWLEVVVRTGEGGEVFTNSVPIGAEPQDAAGKPAMPWNAVKLGRDTRIGPRERMSQTWQFPFPESKPEHLDVRVSVYYRSISELAAQTAGIEPSPAIEIATDRLRIFKNGGVEKLPVDLKTP
jgi:hypothetical protein